MVQTHRRKIGSTRLGIEQVTDDGRKVDDDQCTNGKNSLDDVDVYGVDCERVFRDE